MTNKINVCYIGYNLQTLFLILNERKINVNGIGKIDFSTFKTLNPFNYFFKFLYFYRENEKSYFFERIILFFWIYIFNYFSSGIYKKYSKYLITICDKKIKILDLEDKKTVLFLKGQDLLIVDTWEILSKDIVTSPKKGTINIHPSKLPKYAGALPTLWALKNNDEMTAVTYMVINERMDTGSIIAQYEIKIEPKDDYFSIEKNIAGIIQKTLVKDIEDYFNGFILPKDQDLSRRTLTDKYEDYKIIFWNKETAKEIFNKVNLYPYLIPEEFCYFKINNKNFYLKSIRFSAISQEGRFGFLGVIFNCKTKEGYLTFTLFRDTSVVESFLLLFLKFKI